jgi:hypothetical protein
MANATQPIAAPKPLAKARKPRKPVDPNETKQQRFVRLANHRVTRALKLMGHIRNLSTRGSYEYTPDQAAKIVHALKTSVAIVEEAFAGRAEQAQGFSV